MKYRHELIIRKKKWYSKLWAFGYVVDQWIDIEGDTMDEIDTKIDDIVTIYQSKYPDCDVEVRFRDVQVI